MVGKPWLCVKKVYVQSFSGKIVTLDGEIEVHETTSAGEFFHGELISHIEDEVQIAKNDP